MVYLIVGRTGSGKDFLAQKLTEKGFKPVKSYTTRPKRTETEDTHIFIPKEEAANYTNRAASAIINGNEYFGTIEQVEKSDLYVINPDAIDELLGKMPETEFQIIYVQADDEINRRAHAVKRADDKIKEEEVFNKRDEDEDEQFSKFEEIIFEKMDTDICFPENMTRVLIYKNDYNEENVVKYANTLLMYKRQLEHMKTIINECVQLGIMTATDNNKIQTLYTYESGETETKTQTIEHAAITILNNDAALLDVLRDYIALSPRFDQTDEQIATK